MNWGVPLLCHKHTSQAYYTLWSPWNLGWEAPSALLPFLVRPTLREEAKEMLHPPSSSPFSWGEGTSNQSSLKTPRAKGFPVTHASGQELPKQPGLRLLHPAACSVPPRPGSPAASPAPQWQDEWGRL